MEGLPVTLQLKGRRCLVVGGGAVAARKVSLLLRAGAHVLVVAPRVADELQALADEGRIRHVARRFAPRDLARAALAVVATGDRAVNAAAAAAAEKRGIPVNVVDDPALCTVTMPAIVERGPVSVAISTGGASPTLARRLRAEIERALPHGIGALARFAARHRRAVKAGLPDAAARRRFWDAAMDGPIAEGVLAGRLGEAEAMLRAALARAATGRRPGCVHLVGAGPGAADLLTIKAWRLLQKADVVVYDRLVGEGVLALARHEAERIFVGKRRGAHCLPQHEINALLIRLARAGKTVVRLTGGDPFVFGRGGEEREAVRAAGVRTEVVPGITAATGCAAAAGISLTHRDHAHACLFVAAHQRHGRIELDWPTLIRPRQTPCISMGVSVVGELMDRLIAAGLKRNLPAALIENGTMPNQRIIVATVGDLAKRVAPAGVNGPGLPIVGEVAGARPSAKIGAAEAAAMLRRPESALVQARAAA